MLLPICENIFFVMELLLAWRWLTPFAVRPPSLSLDATPFLPPAPYGLLSLQLISELPNLAFLCGFYMACRVEAPWPSKLTARPSLLWPLRSLRPAD